MIGRPSIYSPDLADRLCELIASGMSLRKACEIDGIPSTTTVMKWLREREDFAAQYARAREVQAEHYAEDIVEIADTEPDAARARVRVDARKWTAAKLLPKKYGDRVNLDHSGSIQTLTDEQIAARFAELQARVAGNG